ncbi:MAG: carboxypeptidase-like regulatory domain-containing protein [Treponema sp.]|uniref:carboxypeptidase-like regulatory domain-containing protein n=1 Tax=Treponema sp. TaxID=166 RepID=UPI002A9186FB|nr:carboxypeptidase-like regulatory domain-containing protein [Treponema sp.]MDY6397504.1 carboxypeptidase-like regulatory domain-containing protein [Treponema sp.]
MKKLLRLISVATILLAATSFMACSSDDDDDDSGARSVSARTSGSVVGVVLDNKGEPVKDATVTLGGKSVTTNKGGEFEITGVNPNDKSLITARKANTTTSTATDGEAGGSLKTESTETALSSTESSVASGETAYTLTVTKDGYLPGTISGVYVTYTETEEQEVTRANALLHGLQYDYQDVLKAYAATLSNATATGSTATTTTTATEDTTATTTVQTGSNADRVFKDVSEAISALKNMYKTGSYTEYFSTFGKSTGLIPLDASLKGSLKLNLTSKEGTTWAETTYKPTSKPTIHVSYVVAGNADYTWSAQANAEGIFEFKENLPSGVPLTISVDSFQETIESNDYWFSSESMIVLVDNSGAEEATTGVKTVTLGSKDVNSETYRFLLFAQNDKLWVTKTNTETTASGVLLSKNSNLTFTFNKPVKKVDIVIGTNNDPKTTGFNNLTKDAYDAELSEDKKTVTFTPKLGYWDLTGANQKVVLEAEAEDGTTKLEKTDFPVYFDNKVWVNVKDLSYDDYNDLRKLSDPIVLVFSKPMNEKIAVDLKNNNTAYTEAWNEDKTELTLTPDTKVGYWDLDSGKDNIEVRIVKDFANSKDTYIDEFGYWKVGAVAAVEANPNANPPVAAATAHIKVYFDAYNDVTIAKAAAGFTVTFDKPIKAQTESELKANLNVYKVGTAYAENDTKANATAGNGLADVVLALSEDGKTITVTPQNTEFANYGYYSLVFAKDKFVAKTGEKILRKPATTKTIQTYANNNTTTPFVTTFTLGTEFKYTAVTVVDKLPETALASRAIYVDNDKYLKITFNKEVRKSELKINKVEVTSTTAASYEAVTNYIDGKDVYLPLATRGDNVDVKVQGTVTSKDGQTWDLGSATAGFDTLYKVNKLSYQMVATSLYEVKKAIAEGASTTAGNDATVTKIDPATTEITFTFAEDVSAATWTAEFYDSDNVKFKNLDQTPYIATAAAAGKVVTVTLSSDGKARDFDKTYYLSLKATKGTGDDVVVLYDSSKTSKTATSTTAYGPLPGRASTSTATLNSAIIADVTISSGNTQSYIEVKTKTEDEVAGLDNLYVVESSNNKASKTTDVKEFAKSNASPIVLEFSEDITGFTGILATGKFYTGATDAASSASNWLTKDDVDASKTYASTSKVEGKVLTITPTYAFTSKANVYPVVFNKDGKRIALKKVVDAANAATFLDADGYVAAELKWDNDNKADKATNELFNKTTSTKLVVTNFDKANVGNSSDLYFSFTAIPSETSTSTTPVYGKYTLYKKVAGINDASKVWKKLTTYEVEGTNKLKAVNTDKLETVNIKVNPTKTERVDSVKDASSTSFSLAGLSACIQTTADVDEFNFAATADYKVVCEIDNVEIHSNVVTVTDKKVYVTIGKDATTPFTGATSISAFDKDNVLVITDPSYATEQAWTETTFTVKAKELSSKFGFIKSVEVDGKQGTVSGVAANADGRIGKATYETKLVDDSTWTVTVKNSKTEGGSVYVAEGDTITIKVKDAKNTEPTTYTIKFAK